ncbi:MAG: hypothetical protein QM775_01415 [Pirellulales bacterium]
MPSDHDARQGPPKLTKLDAAAGYLGAGWDAKRGGYQDLETAPVSEFSGDKSVASWLIHKEYAADWRQFQREGEIRKP